jgi:hypothetical protein
VPNVLHTEIFPSAVVLLSLVDNSLLVYTADNSLYHFLVIPTAETIKLHMCGSISFEGVVAAPGLVRCMSWMIPASHKSKSHSIVPSLAKLTNRFWQSRGRFAGGDDTTTSGRPTSLVTATQSWSTVLICDLSLTGYQGDTQELKYDMQILADRIEFCWIHLRGIGSLENSLWGYDGETFRIWLDALNIDMPVEEQTEERTTVPESVSMTLDFYPLCKLSS